MQAQERWQKPRWGGRQLEQDLWEVCPVVLKPCWGCPVVPRPWVGCPGDLKPLELIPVVLGALVGWLEDPMVLEMSLESRPGMKLLRCQLVWGQLANPPLVSAALAFDPWGTRDEGRLRKDRLRLTLGQSPACF